METYFYVVGSRLVLACDRPQCRIVTRDEHNRVIREDPYRLFLRWRQFDLQKTTTVWNDHINTHKEA